MPTHDNAASAQASKHDLAIQALGAALEFERYLAGSSPSSERIAELANHLSTKARPLDKSAPFKLVEPGYLGALRNLAWHYDQSVKTVEAVQDRVIEMAKKLERFAEKPGDSDNAKELRDICLSLHRELLQELMSEETPRHDWQRELHRPATGIGPA